MIHKIYLIICFQIWIIQLSHSNQQHQAERHCRIKKMSRLINYLGHDIFYLKGIGLKCDIKNSDFTLDADSYTKIENKIIKHQKIKGNYLGEVEFNWPYKIKASSSLTKKFNLDAFMRLFSNFSLYTINFHNLHSIDLDLFEETQLFIISKIYLINSDLRFTINGKPVKTCGNLALFFRNKSFNISSLFQIWLVQRKRFYLFGCRFPLTLCPLIFYRSNIKYLMVFDLVQTFYKTNLMKFSNDTFDDLNSTILSLNLLRCENIGLDTQTFLNPSVFKNLESIYIFCSVSSISANLFPTLKNLWYMKFQTLFFRKLIHRNGIEWIKAINRGIHVNLSNLFEFIYNSDSMKFLYLETAKGYYIEPMSRIFPDEDFCIYRDYPFDQLVFTMQFCNECTDAESYDYLKKLNPSYSCTYLWINKYYYLFKYVYQSEKLNLGHLSLFLNSNSYKNRKLCDFQKRLTLCNRSAFQLKSIWDPLDYSLINKKIQIGVKIFNYLVSLFSIATNILVIRIIFSEHNKHVFKDFKHYTYLGLISVFSLSISVIEIVSWLSECFYPFVVFCLAVHKTIVAQLFKMVVKECLVITLRFLSNFCYIAFALCRISLIGRDHNTLIKFMSKVTIWKYVLCSLITSLVFSWIKYFKYSINLKFGELNFPIWNERDIATPSVILPPILDFYMVFNVISDLLNYLVFVILCFVVDLGMLVRLKSTVNESLERIKSMGSNDNKQFEKKKSELEAAMKKSIRMVVVNTSIGLLFKLPLVFLPFVNAIAKFYYKDTKTRYNNPGFDRFYSHLFETDFYSLIQDLTELLYLISISIQFFIYKKFDKKFNEATFSPPPSKNKNTQN